MALKIKQAERNDLAQKLAEFIRKQRAKQSGRIERMENAIATLDASSIAASDDSLVELHADLIVGGQRMLEQVSTKRRAKVGARVEERQNFK